MADVATPNLPARSFDATLAFYEPLGFTLRWRGPHWMILERGSAMLEFFPYPDLDPAESSFGCCIRLDELDGFYRACKEAGIPEARTGHPRINPPRTEDWGGRVAFLVDPDGTLLRLVQN